MRALWLVLLLGCGPKKPVEPVAPVPVPIAEPGSELNPAAVVGVADPTLRQLLSDHWEATMEASPGWATRLGDHRYDDRLADNSDAARKAWRDRRRAYISRAEDLDPDALGPADRLTRELFLLEQRTAASTEVCRFDEWSIGPRSNALGMVNGLPEALEVHSPSDAMNLLARYRAAPARIDTEIANLRGGLDDGLVANAHSLGLVVEMIDTQLDQELDAWPLMEPVTAERDWEPPEGWAGEVRAAVEEIRAALERYRDFVRDELVPAGRPSDHSGIGALPVGEACYGALVWQYTTLDRSPDEVHQQGLDALEGIHAEFRELGEKLWGTDDLAEIFERLRTDEALYFESSRQVQAKAEDALGRARAAIPEWFGTLPQAECVVEPIPDYSAPYTTIAYYQQATPGERPGTYFVNTYAPETRPRHEAEVLAFHEAIPGHHLQIAISQELPEVPAFRKHGGFTVFVEGWALYTERLADEMGLYSGDVDRLGMLSFDAWRASRLVVDTGIHAKGWSREQAVDFMRQNTPLAANNIDNEVDRYITWPGQAVAYKTGQTELWRLRREAEERLGEDFEVKGFHDVVLGAGAVPIPVLRARVEAWIQGR